MWLTWFKFWLWVEQNFEIGYIGIFTKSNIFEFQLYLSHIIFRFNPINELFILTVFPASFRILIKQIHFTKCFYRILPVQFSWRISLFNTRQTLRYWSVYFFPRGFWIFNSRNMIGFYDLYYSLFIPLTIFLKLTKKSIVIVLIFDE